MSRSSGFRCPGCGAAHHWVVDECDACGFRSEASVGWEREGKLQARRELWTGWNWWHWWCIGDIVEGLFWIGRIVFGAIRAILSSWL